MWVKYCGLQSDLFSQYRLKLQYKPHLETETLSLIVNLTLKVETVEMLNNYKSVLILGIVLNVNQEHLNSFALFRMTWYLKNITLHQHHMTSVKSSKPHKHFFLEGSSLCFGFLFFHNNPARKVLQKGMHVAHLPCMLIFLTGI